MMVMGRQTGRRAAVTAIVMMNAVLAGGSIAHAQTSGVLRKPDAQGNFNPRVVEGLIKPRLTPEEKKEEILAPFSRKLRESGLKLHGTFLDFMEANPSAGTYTGNTANSGYLIVGADADLEKILGIKGGTFHFEETIFTLRSNVLISGEIGDNSIGYPPPYNLRPNQLSLLTYEQHLLNDKLVIEAGRTHPNRYFAAPNCQVINSCYQDVLYINAGYVSPQYSMWGGRVSYAFSPGWYVEAGSFATNPNANSRSGWDWGLETPQGALTMVEIGEKTDFSNSAYPGSYSFTAFYNNADHNSFKTASGQPKAYFPGDPLRQSHGTQGLVLNTQQTVWRADGGKGKTMTPTALVLYSGLGLGLDATAPIQSDLYVGATLQAPFQSRPNDRFGVKIKWERMTGALANYLAQANAVAGGTGGDFSRDKAIFELNAHIQLYSAVAFEPVFDYIVNPNSYYTPTAAKRPQDGVYVGGTFILPFGAMLGL
ncbi:Porin [Granulibacter bethesdensis]|uniref:Porin n=2 Tax=Granulibacter bethesdensis TaxID=364410 RepID=A0AAN0VH16_9PROT|nr:Porin [Granulibacter bethesdensis]AHJ66882.1 Porin [Granulibacter bethesdensis CGDNIH4]